MQVGCGFRIMVVKNREYVYFWHYEDRAGRSRQVYAYMGPKRSARTARRLSDAMDSYYAKAIEELRQDLASARSAIVSLRV
ncbi:MAG: hypothetical protein AABX97_04755 [Candidatus Thermoplasmatota archaeon]|mgnify:CR=1 FL=1